MRKIYKEIVESSDGKGMTIFLQKDMAHSYKTYTSV